MKRLYGDGMKNNQKKIKIIVMGTGEFTIRLVAQILKDERFEMLGIVCDESVEYETVNEYRKAISKMGVKSIFSIHDSNLSRADIIFCSEYRRLIPKEYVEKYKIINSHAGILPKYRGFSANPWAIINGENEIGYTIHAMDEKMDHGDIYYVGRIPIGREQTYADVYDDMLNDMESHICDILVHVYSQELPPKSQEGHAVVYTSRFFPTMGDLEDFDKESEYIYNLYRSMAKPHGTGVYFWYKGKKYYPGKMKTGVDVGVGNYIGIPGKVVNCESGEIWVKSKDNVVILSEITGDDKAAVAKDFFRVGNKFGR